MYLPRNGIQGMVDVLQMLRTRPEFLRLLGTGETSFVDEVLPRTPEGSTIGDPNLPTDFGRADVFRTKTTQVPMPSRTESIASPPAMPTQTLYPTPTAGMVPTPTAGMYPTATATPLSTVPLPPQAATPIAPQRGTLDEEENFPSIFPQVTPQQQVLQQLLNPRRRSRVGGIFPWTM